MGSRQTVWRMILDSLLYGESRTFDRMLTGRAYTPFLVTASAQVISGPAIVAGFHCQQGSGGWLNLTNGTGVASGTPIHQSNSNTGYATGYREALVPGGDVYCSGGLYAGVNSGSRWIVYGHAVVNSA